MRAICAFVAFNIYALVLLFAFQKNAVYLFDAELVAEMRATGEMLDIDVWGWKDHYVWRLFASVVVTALAAFLAGAIARKNGARVAAIANIPSIIVWIATFYIMASGETQWEGQTGFMIVSAVAIPLTTWIAYHAGRAGADIQASEFAENTVLGIRPYHWIWISLPIYLYALGIVFVVVKFLALQLATVRDMSLVGALISVLALVPVVAWFAPIVFTYKVLAGISLTGRSAAVKALASSGAIIGGFLLATVVQFASFWLLQKLMSWWYT